jgi:DNA cross-link repair 1A protein
MCCARAGWTFRRSAGLHVQRPSSCVALVGIPYSEHSSWDDLRSCVARLRPKVLIPTVNAATRSQQLAQVDRFADLMDLSGNKGRIDAYLTRAAPAASQSAGTAGAGTGAPQGPAAAAAQGTEAAAAAAAGAAAGTGDAAQGPQESCAAPSPHVSWEPCNNNNNSSSITSPAAVASSSVQRQELDGPVDPPGQAADAEGLFDLGGVDVQEQQRLLEEAARRQRLQKSVLLQRKGRLSGRVSKRRPGTGTKKRGV